MKRRNRNVVIRYNVSQNDRNGIYFYGFESSKEARDIHIYNNTHFVRKGLKVQVIAEDRTPLNSRFENNIFCFEDRGTWGKRSKGGSTSSFVRGRPERALICGRWMRCGDTASGPVRRVWTRV